jgi:hypothetical protein
VIKDILPGQPISLRRLDKYIVFAKNVFDRVLLSNDIPVTDMLPCLLTKLMCRKDDAIKNYWITCTREQLRSIFMTIPEMEAMPSMDSIAECSRVKPGEWRISPVESYVWTRKTLMVLRTLLKLWLSVMYIVVFVLVS